MFILGVAFLIIGYALQYTGAVNMLNGGQGPTFWQAIGIESDLTAGGPAAGGGVGSTVGGGAAAAAQAGANVIAAQSPSFTPR